VKRPRTVRFSATAAVLVAAALLAGCDQAPVSVPESPPDAIQVVVEGLSDAQPQVLWMALPPSYQADIRGLISTFCDNMDQEIYDQTFRIMSKSVKVLNEKKEYIFNSPIALSVPLLESSMGPNWEETVGLLNTVAESDLSSLDSLRQMEPGAFLASTGHEVMRGLENLRAGNPRYSNQNPWEKALQTLEEAQIQFVTTNGNRGYLTFNSAATNATKEVKLTQVEGRWIPTDMAASWQERMAEAKERMAGLSGPEFENAKPMLSLALATLEGAMDSLLKAGSQQDFDTTLAGLASLGGMLKSMRPPPP